MAMKTYPPGTRIGQFEVAGHPLMGGMSIVYVCLDHQENRPVALKTFQPQFLPDRAARDRFLREGTAWVDLGPHSHIVRCYGVFQPGNSIEVYLVLELVAKEQGHDDASLRSWLAPGQPLPVEQALLFALQIARGMRHATEKIPGFVHRDLKPENVLVGADRLSGTDVNRLRVTDFGLVTVLQEADGQTSEVLQPSELSVERTQLTHDVVGTPLYMAPEQWRGESVSTATDIYGFGCILYKMLVGRHAVAGRTVEALQRAHCAGNVRPLPHGLPVGVRALVTRCLALEPGRRYREWEEAESALMAIYAAVAGQAAPKPEPRRALDRAERVAVGGSYNVIGGSYLEIGKAEVAARYFGRALEVGRTEGERRLEGAALGDLGNAYAALGDAYRAIECCEQALVIARETGDRHAEGSDLNNLGEAYRALGDVRRAIGYYERHLDIAHEIGDRKGESASLGNMGSAYADLGDFRRAIAYYEQSPAIGRKIGDRRGEGHALGNLGVAYKNLGNLRRAITYYEQSLAVKREIGDRRGEGNSLGNLGEAYRLLGNARRALGYQKQALAIHREIGDRRREGAVLGNMGSAHIQLGDVHRAIECYEQALAIDREVGDVAGIAIESFNMAILYSRLGKASRALELAQEAARIYTQIGHAEYAQRAHELAARLKARRGAGAGNQA
jgi:tetratricopeptide (TPR) repeat protein